MRSQRSPENAMWRAVRSDVAASRNRAEATFTDQMVRLLEHGALQGMEFAAGHWRIWNPADPATALDYWPRTGTLVRAGQRLSTRGLRGALKLLGVSPSP